MLNTELETMQYSEIEQLIQDDIGTLNNLLTARLGSDIVLINQISHYIINSGGKRIRPLIVLLLCGAMGYHNKYKHLMAAVIELIHTATLLHDDVVDESDLRRGQDTANQKWGNSAAVLVGDFLYSRAFEMMVEPNNMQIMQIIAKATNQIAEGEVMQLMNCGRTDLTEAEYYATIERKTACLFEAASQISGALAGYNQQQLAQLANFGINLGNSFQIIDDILDYRINAQITGKEAGDDLAEGKVTLPLIYALNRVNKTDKQVLIQAIQNKELENIQSVVDILEKNNAFDYAIKQATSCVVQAKDAINFLPDTQYKTALINLCHISLDRKS